MNKVYPSPKDNTGECDVEIDGKMYFNVGYSIEPPEPGIGFRGGIEVTHPAIGYIVDATPYQIKKCQELEDKLIEAVEKHIDDESECQDYEIGEYRYNQHRDREE